MRIKLIACDLDGTLLNSGHTVSERTRAAINGARAAGARFCIITGRMFCSAVRFAEFLSLDTPLAAYNGALIKGAANGRVYFSQPIDRETAQEILSFAKANGFYLQKYVNDRLYVEKINEKARSYAQKVNVSAHAEGDAFYELSAPPDKLLFIVDPAEKSAVAQAIERKFSGRVAITSSGPRFIEIIRIGVNKGEALAYIARFLRVGRRDVMACGDSFNDLEMLDFAGLSVAMNNAAPEIRAAADFVSLNNDEDGVALAIEKYVLGRRLSS
ncbi:MAG: Cof-type HAD-IIB family hydrolase [Acidaminococcales bacterium]|jgi:Cof subfamily protein (haloacid dehalogenase superfamily)|nr:Cof-type HAD-IIB family hydrolase [Acidaminococcales bacterium]